MQSPTLPAAPGEVGESALRDYGRALGAALGRPAFVALGGDLGSGKTTLAQAIAAGAGVEGEVTSPTFALVHQHTGRGGAVFHLDLYRLRGPDDLTNIGWDDILQAEAIVLVEWAERAGERLPRPRLDIHLRESPDSPDRRVVEATWKE